VFQWWGATVVIVTDVTDECSSCHAVAMAASPVAA
jgi:hypothetical protein